MKGKVATPTRRTVAGGLAGLLLATSAPARSQGMSMDRLSDLARRAAIYLFPLHEMYHTRWNATVNPDNPRRGRLNRFGHVPVLANAQARAITTPNNDTLYSSAWLDLSGEPLFLTVPAMDERYYSFAFMDLFTNNFTYVCRRLHGGKPATRMIVGPRWSGATPADVELVRAPTNSVWLLGRILVDGPGDLPADRALQAKTLLETPDMRNERRIVESRELMRQRTTVPDEPVAAWPATNPSDPWTLLDVGAAALGESPTPERDAALLDEFRALGLRAGRRFDPLAFSVAERDAILAGIAVARAEIADAGRRRGRHRDGWSYADKHLGNFGDDHLYRAHVALAGLAALEPVEATYMTADVDAEAAPLDGANRYVLRFEPGALPPARAFWSLSMYERTPEGRAFFVDNRLGRFAIGDRTRGLRRGPDGSLEIAIQRESPGADHELNWLPAPSGRMRLTLRVYEPDKAILDGAYLVPPVRRVG